MTLPLVLALLCSADKVMSPAQVWDHIDRVNATLKTARAAGSSVPSDVIAEQLAAAIEAVGARDNEPLSGHDAAQQARERRAQPAFHIGYGNDDSTEFDFYQVDFKYFGSLAAPGSEAAQFLAAYPALAVEDFNPEAGFNCLLPFDSIPKRAPRHRSEVAAEWQRRAADWHAPFFRSFARKAVRCLSPFQWQSAPRSETDEGKRFKALHASVAQVVIDAGVYPVAGAELFTQGFSIDRRAQAYDPTGGFSIDGCDLPTPDEWLAASTQTQFELGPQYDLVGEPWWREAGCQGLAAQRAQNAGAAEAGDPVFDVQYYAQGTVPDAGTGLRRIIPGQGQDSNQGDPTPRAYRCVRRAPPGLAKRRFVAASGINLRLGRGPEYAIVDGAGIGTEVGELTSVDAWSFVTVTIECLGFDYPTRGWVKTDLLGDTAPDRAALLASGRAQLAAGQLTLAATQLERALAFDREDASTRELLLQAYDRAGRKGEADALRREARKKRRHR